MGSANGGDRSSALMFGSKAHTEPARLKIASAPVAP